jgi:hypothetical protein
MSSLDKSKCDGCGVGIGECHAPGCERAFCWHCGDLLRSCGWSQRLGGERFPWAGDLDGVFASHNRHYCGRDLDEWDFWPTYEGDKLVGLRANTVGPGPWHVIETSPQARDLAALTFPLPHLSLQTGDDCVEALLASPLLPRLRALEFGDAQGGWGRWLGGEDCLSEGKNTAALVRLVERLPRVTRLYLGHLVPEPDRLLAATFPPLLEALLVRSLVPLDLGALAGNDSLPALRRLLVHQGGVGELAGGGFHDRFRALVNAPGLDGVRGLHVNIPQVDDACCAALAASRMVKHLSGLWLAGQGLTDAGAAALAASPDVRALEELALDGPNLTEAGRATLRATGVRLLEDEDIPR